MDSRQYSVRNIVQISLIRCNKRSKKESGTKFARTPLEFYSKEKIRESMNKEATISWNYFSSNYPIRGEWWTIFQRVHQVIPDRMACGIPTVYLTLTPSIDTNSSQTFAGALDSCRLAELNIGIKSGHRSLNKRSSRSRNFHRRNLDGSQPSEE